MKPHLLSTTSLLAVSLVCNFAQAQTASPYYSAPLQLTTDKDGVTASVGNVLCYNNRREFPAKTEPEPTDELKQSTNLNIGGTYKEDYYTFAVNAPEAGQYTFTFQAAHKNDTRSLWIHQASVETVGTTDEGVTYTQVGEDKMPITGGWTNYQGLPFTFSLTEGYNLVKIVFDDKYGGNIGSLCVTRSYPLSPDFTAITLGGVDIMDQFTDEKTEYTVKVPRGNALPVLNAEANEKATVQLAQATADNLTATVTLVNKETSETIKTYTIIYKYVDIAEGYNFTWTTGDGTTDKTYTSDDEAYKAKRTSVANAAFSIVGASDVYSDSRFKIKAGEKYALIVPANAKVEKVTFGDCYENYYNKDENKNTDSEWSPLTSGSATGTFADDDASITTSRDITVTFANHQAGTPIEFSVKKCVQVAFSTIKIEYSQVNDQNLNYIGSNIADGETKGVSGTVQLHFDREVTATDAASIKLDGADVERYTISGSTVKVYYWNLTPSASHTMTMAANSVQDIFKNANADPVSITFTTEAQKTVQAAKYDYVVATAEELHAAIEEVNASNTAADSPRKRIYVKNGDYVMDTTEKYDDGQGKAAITLTANNVSIVGQSEEGTILRSLCTNDGQGTAVLEIKGQGTYLQDITLRTADFRTEQFLTDNTSYGRLLAVYVNGGKKTVMKRVTLQSNQDTYLCGHLGYHEDCTIHGTVDFIYAGGDNLFYNNTIVMENGGVIGAPATNVSQQWGLVFDGCTIKASNACYAEAGVKYEGYSLARPWQGEPRCYWLNTTMEILPSDNGWRGMSNLTTHFYEYNSMDKDGNKLDLTKRGNSDSSVNKYTPVLTDAEAAEFTVHNILGGDDGWEPATMTVLPEAPKDFALAAGKLSWQATTGAIGYVIYNGDKFLGNVTETTFDLKDMDETAQYTVAAVNEMGGQGSAAKLSPVTGINAPDAATDSHSSDAVYTISGQRVANGVKGLKGGIYIVNNRKVYVK